MLYEVSPRLRHHGFELRTQDRAAQHGHGPLTIDNGLHSELVVGIPGLAEAAHVILAFVAPFVLPAKSFRGASSEPAMTVPSPMKVRRFHEPSLMNFLLSQPLRFIFATYFLVIAAMQLISIIEFPGSADPAPWSAPVRH